MNSAYFSEHGPFISSAQTCPPPFSATLNMSRRAAQSDPTQIRVRGAGPDTRLTCPPRLEVLLRHSIQSSMKNLVFIYHNSPQIFMNGVTFNHPRKCTDASTCHVFSCAPHFFSCCFGEGCTFFLLPVMCFNPRLGGEYFWPPPSGFFVNSVKTAARGAAFFCIAVRTTVPQLSWKFWVQVTQGQVTRSGQVTPYSMGAESGGTGGRVLPVEKSTVNIPQKWGYFSNFFIDTY